MRIFFFLSSLCLCLAAPLNKASAQHEDTNMKLDNIIRHVYETNPGLMAARVELQETMEQYPQARAGWRPTITAEASIFSTRVESSNFSNADGATTKDITLSVDQPIWRGGRTFSETASARDLIRAGEAVLKQAEQDIFLAAASAYMNVLRDDEILNLRTQNTDILSRELNATKERMEIGDITNTDVQQAKARLAQAKSEYALAERDLHISKAEFEATTGMIPHEKLIPPQINLPIPQTLDHMFILAENQNPQILIAQFEKTAARHNADATFKELLPQISAFASANRQYDPQPGIVDRSENETIGLRASLQLYQGGATRSRIRESRRTVKRIEYEIEDLQRRIKQEIINNYRSYIAAQAQTGNYKEEIIAAELALEGVREEAKMGQRSVLDVLDADQESIDAKANLAHAKRNETVALFALANTLGILTPKNVMQAPTHQEK